MPNASRYTPPKRRIDAAQQEQILALVRWLNEQKHDLALDDIDGRFYWEICRSDFVQAINDAAALQTSADDHAQCAIEIGRRFMVLPLYVYNRIKYPEQIIPLHSPYAEVKQFGDGEYVVNCYVHSGDMTGELFSDWLVKFVDQFQATGIEILTLHDVVSIFLEVQFTEDYQDEWPHQRGLSFLVRLPLPHREIVAAIFDAVMRVNPSWRLVLAHDHSSKDPNANEIAIRTWGIGLLMKLGLPYFGPSSASELISEAMNIPPVKKSTDGAARQTLAQRVSIADQFLRSR